MHTQSNPNPILLTVNETANMLSISRSKVFMLLRTNELASVRIGTAVRITLTEVQRYVDSLTQSGEQ